jgi:hypothetical protein
MNDPRIPDLKPPTGATTERSEVERPLLLQIPGTGQPADQLMAVSSFCLAWLMRRLVY